MITVGALLLILGFVFDVAILWTLGIILLVVGAILVLLGAAGRAVGGDATTSDPTRPRCAGATWAPA